MSLVPVAASSLTPREDLTSMPTRNRAAHTAEATTAKSVRDLVDALADSVAIIRTRPFRPRLSPAKHRAVCGGVKTALQNKKEEDI